MTMLLIMMKQMIFHQHLKYMHYKVQISFLIILQEKIDAVIGNINVNARIVISGTMGMPSYSVLNGPKISKTLIVKIARIKEFLVLDYFDKHFKFIINYQTALKMEN